MEPGHLPNWRVRWTSWSRVGNYDVGTIGADAGGSEALFQKKTVIAKC